MDKNSEHISISKDEYNELLRKLKNAEHEVAELVKSKEIVEQANNVKEEFLSRMSHEIRTSLNSIFGVINIGIDTDDIDKKDYCFARANSASKYLLGIMNDILDMIKIESNKFELSYQEFNFEQTLKDIAEMANERAGKKRQNFIINLNDDVPSHIISDELRLSQVITNLVTNAIKYTPVRGTIILSIEKIEEINDNVLLRITVSDTGIGISREQQEKFFMPFHEAASTISQKFGGTGLSLTISKRIVELMDGEIWVESDLAKGAKFMFTMKTKKVEGRISAKLFERIDKDEAQILAANDFSKNSLLIVDDIKINRDIMSAILEKTGISIDFAKNGKEAVLKFQDHPDKYNLILMDIQMPEMDGYEATRTIRSLDCANAKTIPIIAMTADVFKGDIEKCIAAGMNSHLGKPIDINDLYKELELYLLPK